MSVKQRVIKWLKLKKESGTTQVKLAESFGVKPQYMSELVNGKGSYGISIINQLLDFDKELNARWLILGEGKMYDSNKIKEYSTYNELTKAAENNPNTNEEMNELVLTQKELIKMYRETNTTQKEEIQLLKMKLEAIERGNGFTKEA